MHKRDIPKIVSFNGEDSINRRRAFKLKFRSIEVFENYIYVLADNEEEVRELIEMNFNDPESRMWDLDCFSNEYENTWSHTVEPLAYIEVNYDDLDLDEIDYISYEEI